MTKKIEHLTTELQEFFSQKDAKKLETHIQKLSEMREDFTVPKPLKQQLKKRLEHIHGIEHASKNTSFSWFSYVGIFSSLCLVFSVVYALFDTRTLDTTRISELPMGAQVQDMSSEQTQM